MSTIGHASAEASANIALVKYWGKRDPALNLPRKGSIAVTLDELRTRTTVAFDRALTADRLVVDGVTRSGVAASRTTRVLDLVRARAGLTARASVVSENTFPYAAGLASSASGMAALTLAACEAAGLELALDEAAVIARRGSGSATRSLHGGFVEWRAGHRADGSDSHGVALHPPDYWDLCVLVAIVDQREKTVPSTNGMALTAASSPYYESWLQGVDHDLEETRRALATRDLPRLGRVVEASALRMHAAAMSCDPGLVYWRGPTVELIHEIRALRTEGGLPAWFTIDAGPHVKVITLPEHARAVAARLWAKPGVERVIECRVGGPAEIVRDDEAAQAI